MTFSNREGLQSGLPRSLSLFAPKFSVWFSLWDSEVGALWQLESPLFLEHKGNIFRPFLPPAVLKNTPWRGEELHTRPAEKRPFLLPQDTAEMLCHPQVDTCILPVTFTFLSRNFALFFPLPEITVCFPFGQAMAEVPCCLWAAQVPVLLPVIPLSSVIPPTTWGPPGDHLGSVSAGFPPSPCASRGQIPLWALAFCSLCQQCDSCPRTRTLPKEWGGSEWHCHPSSTGWDISLPGFVALSVPAEHSGWSSILCCAQRHPWSEPHERCHALLSSWEHPNLQLQSLALINASLHLQTKVGGWGWMMKISPDLKESGHIFVPREDKKVLWGRGSRCGRNVHGWKKFRREASHHEITWFWINLFSCPKSNFYHI